MQINIDRKEDIIFILSRSWKVFNLIKFGKNQWIL